MGYSDLVMSTEGISLNIVENPISEELMKGDLKRAWERHEQRWNLKTREDQVEVYTKVLNYKLENTRQRPMDWNKGPKKAFKGWCGYCGEFGHKAADCPNKKSNQNKGKKSKTQQKKKQQGKGDSKGKGHFDMSKIICFNCGECGHFARDCPKARVNANIAQESEQKGKSESMLDLDSTSVSEECAMVCTELQYEDASEDEVVYGDQGISVEEYENATYDNLMKTQSEEEDEVKFIVAQ